MCDCTAVKEILEYDGGSHQLRRWCQELMGYHFTVIHCCARMMWDVDALTRRFGKAVTLYCMQAYLMRSRDKLARPLAYDFDHFHSTSKPQKVLPPDIPLPAQHAPIDLTTPTARSANGGDVTTESNSNKHDSRFSNNISTTNSENNHNLICSSFVKPFSIVNVCESSKNTINVITPNDANILRLPMINNINNTNCDNLTTIDSICDYKPIRNSNINTNMPTSSRKVNESNISGFSENTEDNVVTSSKDAASTPSLTRR